MIQKCPKQKWILHEKHYRWKKIWKNSVILEVRHTLLRCDMMTHYEKVQTGSHQWGKIWTKLMQNLWILKLLVLLISGWRCCFITCNSWRDRLQPWWAYGTDEEDVKKGEQSTLANSSGHSMLNVFFIFAVNLNSYTVIKMVLIRLYCINKLFSDLKRWNDEHMSQFAHVLHTM